MSYEVHLCLAGLVDSEKFISSYLGVIQIVRSSGEEGGGGSAKNEQSILNLKFFLFKKRTRGEGGLKVAKSERTYYLNGPLECFHRFFTFDL